MRMTWMVAAVLGLGLGGALAEDSEMGLNDDIVAGSSLLEQGAKILLRGVMQEVEPKLGELQDALADAEPMLTELLKLAKNIDDYHLPEVLPNGDILIRKKTAEEKAGDPEVEL